MIHAASRFLKNIGYNMLAEVSVRIGNYLLVIMISRILEVSSAGTFNTAIAYLNIGLLISYWGFANILTREVAKAPESFGKQFSNSLFLRIVFSTITILTIVALVSFLDYDSEVSRLLILLSLSVPAASLNQLISAAFMAFEKIKYLSIVSIFLSLVKIGLGYLFLSQQGGLVSIVILLITCDYLALLVNIFLTKKHLPKFKFEIDPTFCWQLTKIAFPLFGVGLVTMLDSRTEIIIVSLLLGENNVSYYTAVNTILGLFVLFPEGLRYAVLPLLARYSINDDGKFHQIIQKLSKLVLLVTLPISILLFLFSAELIQFIFTAKYIPSITILQIVSWSFFSYSLTVIATRSLIVLNQEKILARIMLTSAIITNILNLIAAPLIGLPGVAGVRLGTSFLLLFMCVYVLAKMGYKMFTLSFVWRLGAVGTLMISGMMITIVFGKWLALITGAIFYIGGLYLFKIIGRKELQTARLILVSLVSENPKPAATIDNN